ncbi:NAD(P)-dependent dehydrogenase (short-subunit alcohol dehydrogenase family) [Lactobacillus colini]|uniref:NAD(P)-dependent dehydrogenase (Short-subunit alcohol dehydrogenase family) n=1 Tax=Lactobacillus colini TaxID=1819254 RepID=A0ABS4MFI8_9LACO|nr:SDR family NAD(P)-dependent oxidoreductase [Lactobacillus colini]MBP2058451.1 NAD(P)-dependent dehydrogenase (short-subunit alcohol dehydrogenase family) [Lactobacillus colini]
MTKDSKVWLITGASRGMGKDFAQAALNNGDKVVVTARKVEKLDQAFEDADNLLKVSLDVTDADSITTALKKAINKFGQIDILLNSAGNFYGGYFEEISPQQMRAQFETNVFGTMSLTRSVLPIMRKQRSGHIITLSSSAGLAGFEFNSAYSASKFALEGWMEALVPELAPFNIKLTIVEPGFFRSEFLTKNSTKFGDIEIADYTERSKKYQDFFIEQNGKQPGNPKKLAKALVQIGHEDNPPVHFVAGEDAIGAAEDKIKKLQADIDRYRNISTDMSFD